MQQWLSSGSTGAGATRTDTGGEVTVSVTWKGPAAGPVFDVAMDTHSVDLDGYDLRSLAELGLQDGTSVKPQSWDALKGGHHRSGTLTFPATRQDGSPLIRPGSGSLTLVLRGIGGVSERTFDWSW
jgi:hypothetical protein